MAVHILPPAAYLHECFIYDRNTGTLMWRDTRLSKHFPSELREKVWITRSAGKNACHEMKGLGYKRTCLDGVWYLSHRIIIKMMTGQDPIHEVDHKNHQRGDNRWFNLRPATRMQNSWNSPVGERKSRNGLPVGITRRGKKFKVECGREYLGTFETLNHAKAAYEGYASVLRGEFFYRTK